MPRPLTAAALTLALLIPCSCAEKPETGDETAEQTGSTPTRNEVPLSWVLIPAEDAMRFRPQAVRLGSSPTPGVTTPPHAEVGSVHYGALRMGAAGQARGEGRELAVAVLESPKPAEGEEARPWLLYVDRDLDGDLAEEEAVAAAPLTQPFTQPMGQIELTGAQFPVVQTLGSLGGLHALLVNVIASEVGDERRVVLQARSACALSGRARILGGERDFVVYDADSNGVFGDRTESADRTGDAIWIDFDGDGRSSGAETLSLAPRLFHDGAVAAVEVPPEKRVLVITPLEVAFGSVGRAGADPSEKLAVQLRSEEYGLVAPTPAERVPVGSYTYERYAIERSDIDGSVWTLTGGWLPGKAPSVRVREDETAELAFGPPVRYELGEEELRAAMIVVRLQGSARESVGVRFRVGGEERAPDWGEFKALDGERVVGRGELRQVLPGAAAAPWQPAEEIEDGSPLTLEISPDLGPFAEGFEGRAEFEYVKPPPMRLVVSGIEPGTQAERVGFRRGDVVFRYDSKLISNTFDLMRAMQEAMGKPRVEMVAMRDGEEVTFALLPGRIGIVTEPVPP